MPVYMIQAGGKAGPVKIGFAIHVEKRLFDLQAANHERLEVIRVLSGGRMEELRLHRRFAPLLMHREWFAFSDEMLGDLHPGSSSGVDYWLSQTDDLLSQLVETGVVTEADRERLDRIWPPFCKVLRDLFAAKPPAEAA